MSDKSKLGTIIDGIAASQHIDSSAECLDIEGMDISSLGSADSILNFEHNSKQHPAQVCGKVTFAKKIFKKSDCSNDRERYFWDFCKKPFVYVKGELFDHPDLDHDGARNVAALLRYDNRDKGEKARRLISFSIEGGKIDKKGMTVTKSIARDLALTIKHCNKMCIAEIVDDIKERKDLYKREQDPELPVLTGVYKEFISDLKKNQHQDYQEKVQSYQDDRSFKQKEEQPKYVLKNISTQNNMRKTLIAGMMGGSPDSKTGMAALASEEIVGQKKVKKNEKLEKMSRPMLRNKELQLGQDVRSDVKSIDPQKTYKTKNPEKPQIGAVELENKKLVQMARHGYSQQEKDPQNIPQKKQQAIQSEAQQEYGNKLNPERHGGVNLNISGHGQKSFAFQSKDKQTGADFARGAGRYGLKESRQAGSEIHEANHGFFTDIENKHGPKHATELSRKLLTENFHPKDLERVGSWLKSRSYKSKNPYFNEEHLTHISDILNVPKARKNFYEHIGFKNPEKIFKQIPSYLKALKTGQGMDRFTPEEIQKIRQVRHIDKRLKSGWKKTAEFTNNPLLLADHFNETNKKKK
jgi:hypothetical protein